MMILAIVCGQVQKIGNFYPQRFNAKTDWLFFLFVMICETWPWYYRFGCGALFPKSDKKVMDSVSGAQTRQFCLVQQIRNFYPQSSKANTGQLSFLFVMIFETGLWYNQCGQGA